MLSTLDISGFLDVSDEHTCSHWLAGGGGGATQPVPPVLLAAGVLAGGGGATQPVPPVLVADAGWV
jgi:hypothetical protein